MSEAKKTDQEIFFPTKKEVIVCGKKYEIGPFVLKNRTKVFAILAGIISKLAILHPQLTKSKNIEQEAVLALVDVAGEKMVYIYEIVLGKSKDELLETMTLPEEIALITAIIEVNDFPFLVERVLSLTKMLNKTA